MHLLFFATGLHTCRSTSFCVLYGHSQTAFLHSIFSGSAVTKHSAEREHFSPKADLKLQVKITEFHNRINGITFFFVTFSLVIMQVVFTSTFGIRTFSQISQQGFALFRFDAFFVIFTCYFKR